MPKQVKVDGKVFIVPDDATPDEIDQISKSSGTPATNAKEASEPDSAPTRFFTSLIGDPRKDIQGVKDKGVVGYLKEQGANAIKSLNPLPAMQDTYQSAVRGWNTPEPGESTLDMVGRKLGAAGRYVESGLPYVGPALAHASEQYDNGDVAGSLGSSTQLGLGAAAGDPNVRAGVASVPGKVANFARHPIQVPKAAFVGGMDKVALGDFTPERILTKAMKPPVTYPEFEDVAHTRLPEIANASRKTPITGVRDFTNVVDDLAAKKNAQYSDLISPIRSEQINQAPIGEAIRQSVPATEAFENLPAVQRVNNIAGKYEPNIRTNPFTHQMEASGFADLGTLDNLRVDKNAKLNSFYNQSGGDQHAALSNPETAATKAARDAAADLVYKNVKRLTGVEPEPIQTAYGDYTDMGNVAGKRATVFGRQQPFPLQETLNVADSLTSPGKFLLSKAFKRYGNSDALTKIALEKFNQQPTQAPRPNPYGLRQPVIGSIAASMRKKQDDEQ